MIDHDKEFTECDVVYVGGALGETEKSQALIVSEDFEDVVHQLGWIFFIPGREVDTIQWTCRFGEGTVSGYSSDPEDQKGVYDRSSLLWTAPADNGRTIYILRCEVRRRKRPPLDRGC
jgi:hypothetical protein